MKNFFLSILSMGLLFTNLSLADDCEIVHHQILDINSKSYALSKTLFLIDEEREEAHEKRLYDLISLNSLMEENLVFCQRHQEKGLLKFEEYRTEAKVIYKEIDRLFIYHFSVTRVSERVSQIDDELGQKFHWLLVANISFQKYRSERIELLYELVKRAKAHIELASPETHFAYLEQLDYTASLSEEIKYSLEKFLAELEFQNKSTLKLLYSVEKRVSQLNQSIASLEESVKSLKADRLKHQVLQVALTAKKIFLLVQLDMAKTAKEKAEFKKKINFLNAEISVNAAKLFSLSTKISIAEKAILRMQDQRKVEFKTFDKYSQIIINYEF
jgi:hypothetical protein